MDVEHKNSNYKVIPELPCKFTMRPSEFSPLPEVNDELESLVEAVQSFQRNQVVEGQSHAVKSCFI